MEVLLSAFQKLLLHELKLKKIVLDVIDNKPGSASDIVCLNAGATLYVAGIAPDIASGITKAKAAISSGAARQKLDAFVAATQSK